MSWQTAPGFLPTIPFDSSRSDDTINTVQIKFALSKDAQALEEHREKSFATALESTRAAIYDTARNLQDMYGGTGPVETELSHRMGRFPLPGAPSNNTIPPQGPRFIPSSHPTMILNHGSNVFTPNNRHQVLEEMNLHRHVAIYGVSWPIGGQPFLRVGGMQVQSQHANPQQIWNRHRIGPAGIAEARTASSYPMKQDTTVSFVPPKVPAPGFLTIMNNYDPVNVLPFLHFLETLKCPSDGHDTSPGPDGHIEEDYGPQMNAWLLSLLPEGRPIVMFRSLAQPCEDDISLLARCVRYSQTESARQMSWAVHPIHVALIMERSNSRGFAKDSDSKKGEVP